MDYSKVVHLFLNLRGKGASISPADLALVELWHRQEIDPDLVEKVLRSIETKKKLKKKPFPASLRVVDNELRKVLFEAEENANDDTNAE